MRSGISFFNRRLSLNLLKRSWPLWVVYALILMLILPFEINSPELREMYALQINRDLLGSVPVMIYVSFVFCAVTAMVMFGYLYNSRSCGLMNSIPVRRETAFFTAVLTGLVPMLLLDLVFFLIAAVQFTVDGFVKMHILWTWLGGVVMANVAFYGMAVFCAMLTGHVIVLPLVYGVLSLTATMVEGLIDSLLSDLMYGFTFGDYLFTFLSPPVTLSEVNVLSLLDENLEVIPGEFYLTNMNWLLIYCIAGLVFIGLALLLYRRRKMETAGDIVAIKQLKPVFKYCMAVGCALVFAVGMYETSFIRSTHGTGTAIVLTAMLPIGAFIGYFAAEMLMQKTLRVFRGRWKGYIVTACVLVALAVCCETDVFGYETWVPDPDEVKYVQLRGTGSQMQEPETIRAITGLHESLIENKRHHESCTEDTMFLTIDYILQDGSRKTRLYYPDASEAAAEDPFSDVMLYQNIMNMDEVRAVRTEFTVPVTPSSIDMCTVSASWWDEEKQNYEGKYLELTAEEAYELYSECIVPDVADGQLAEYFAITGEEYRELKTDTSVYIETVDRSSGNPEKYRYSSMDFQIQVNSERCLEWLKEHTDLDSIPLSQSERPEDIDGPVRPRAAHEVW